MAASASAMEEEGAVRAQFPEKLRFLFESWRYKVAHGGRGGAKSWGFARALLIQGTQEKLRIVCCREIQDSLADSVKELLANQIEELGLGAFYRVMDKEIVGLNGTRFTFHGLRHNVQKLKSLEGADRVWVEEADTVSQDSWDKLIPTVRKEGSEIWVTFNPEFEADDTYQRFLVSPPANAKVVQMSYRDNPWFPDVLEAERLALKEKDEDDYNHVWEGMTVQRLDGAIYAKELRKAQLAGRVGHVPYDSRYGVHVFVDLGFADFTSLWFMQKIGFVYRFPLCYQNQLEKWPHYLRIIQETGYTIHTIWLPHDAEHEHVEAVKTTAGQTRAAGFKVRVVPSPAGAVKARINLVRTVFEHMYFDQKGCEDGLAHLRRYRYEKNARGEFMRTPKHDHNSHFADALGTGMMGFTEGPTAPEVGQKVAAELRQHRAPRVHIPRGPHGLGWMGG